MKIARKQKEATLYDPNSTDHACDSRQDIYSNQWWHYHQNNIRDKHINIASNYVSFYMFGIIAY